MRSGVQSTGWEAEGRGQEAEGRRCVGHVRREELKARHPLHVTLRLVEDVGRARVKRVLGAVAVALSIIEKRDDLRIVHTSIQDNHLHLGCEAESKEALSRGMQAFKTSAARRINWALGRTGRVFADRYHVEVVTTPTQTRAMMCYVLNNWRKHGADRGDNGRVDPFSTGMFFRGWAETDIPKKLVIPPGVVVLPHREPRTWLLREGWKRCRPISLFEVPGPRH
jgi:REP element-mobilizing transposase RayT